MLHNRRSSPRAISTGQLHTLLHFHLRPINQIVFLGPYSIKDERSHLRGSFTLRRFSAFVRSIATQLCPPPQTPTYSWISVTTASGAMQMVIDLRRFLYLGWKKKKPPYNWHRTSGFPYEDWQQHCRKGKKSQAPEYLDLKKSDFYKFGQKILCNLLLKYGFKLNLLVNLKKADVNDIDGIITIRNKDSVINLSVDKSMVSDIRQYNMVHRYPNREYFFLNTKGKKITSSSALATIQEKLEEVNNINTTTLALKGVSKLIQKGLTLSEIKYLTGFETKKIEDVSRWLMNQEDVESVINNKLFQ